MTQLQKYITGRYVGEMIIRELRADLLSGSGGPEFRIEALILGECDPTSMINATTISLVIVDGGSQQEVVKTTADRKVEIVLKGQRYFGQLL